MTVTFTQNFKKKMPPKQNTGSVLYGGGQSPTPEDLSAFREEITNSLKHHRTTIARATVGRRALSAHGAWCVMHLLQLYTTPSTWSPPLARVP